MIYLFFLQQRERGCKPIWAAQRRVALLQVKGIARVPGKPGNGFYFGQDCMEACTKCSVSTPGCEGEGNIHPCSVPQFPHLKNEIKKHFSVVFLAEGIPKLCILGPGHRAEQYQWKGGRNGKKPTPNWGKILFPLPCKQHSKLPTAPFFAGMGGARFSAS